MNPANITNDLHLEFGPTLTWQTCADAVKFVVSYFPEADSRDIERGARQILRDQYNAAEAATKADRSFWSFLVSIAGTIINTLVAIFT